MTNSFTDDINDNFESVKSEIESIKTNYTPLQVTNAINSAIANIPSKTSDLTNDSGFLTGITSANVTAALGFTPYNSTNPNGYITGVNSGDIATALGYTPTSPANVDGQWVFSSKSLSTSGSKNTYSFNLSSSTYNNYLPSDNYCYEVLLSFYGANTNNTKAQATFTFGGQDTNQVSAVSGGSMCTLNGIFPLDSTHTFTLAVTNQAFSTLNLNVLGYRRLGTNS